MTRACVTHEAIEPVFDADSRVLLLGTMPSPRSRAERFYYAHPQNRMWRVLAAVFESPLPVTVEEKKQFLLSHRIAMWDVLASCEIEGASDTSIRNPVPNDLDRIFSVAAISVVFTAGGTAHRLLKKLTGRDSVRLPSTSPANCAIPTEALVEAYRAVARATEGQCRFTIHLLHSRISGTRRRGRKNRRKPNRKPPPRGRRGIAKKSSEFCSI